MARALQRVARARAAAVACVARECMMGEGATTSEIAAILCVSDDTARAWLALARAHHLVISLTRTGAVGVTSYRWYSYHTNTYKIANDQHGLQLQPTPITERIDDNG